MIEGTPACSTFSTPTCAWPCSGTLARSSRGSHVSRRRLPFESEAADHHARLRHALRSRPIGERYLMIASIVRAKGATLVTHNQREFRRVQGLSPGGLAGRLLNASPTVRRGLTWAGRGGSTPRPAFGSTGWWTTSVTGSSCTPTRVKTRTLPSVQCQAQTWSHPPQYRATGGRPTRSWGVRVVRRPVAFLRFTTGGIKHGTDIATFCL